MGVASRERSLPNRAGHGPASDDPTQSVRLAPVICVLLLVLVAIVFEQAITYDFVNYDDDVYVTKNPQITTASPGKGLPGRLPPTAVNSGSPSPGCR